MGAWDISRSFSTGPCGGAGAPASAWNGPSGYPQMMPNRRAAEAPPPPAPALPGCWLPLLWLPQRRKQIVSKQAGTHADSFPSSWLQAASFRNKQRCDHLCCLNSLNCLLPRNTWPAGCWLTLFTVLLLINISLTPKWRRRWVGEKSRPLPGWASSFTLNLGSYLMYPYPPPSSALSPALHCLTYSGNRNSGKMHFAHAIRSLAR